MTEVKCYKGSDSAVESLIDTLRAIAPRKTVLVVRHGAIGDGIQASSVVKGLHDQGYDVDVLAQAPQHVVYENNPYVRNLIVVERDQIANQELTQFWSYLGSKYDKWVNLCESVEGTLLAMPGRTPHFWNPKTRELYMNHSYCGLMHSLAGVPDKLQMKFFPTPSELSAARSRLRGKLNVFCPLAGSSVHKVWPGIDQLFARILLEYPEAHIYTAGDDKSKIIEAPWANEKRIHRYSGDLSIRDTITLGMLCDIAIGPETGFMNAVACEDMPKLLILSHSTAKNYADWPNTTYIRSADTSCPGRGNNEAEACHQLHYGWDHCKNAGGVAQCQADISIDYVWFAFQEAVNTRLQGTP